MLQYPKDHLKDDKITGNSFKLLLIQFNCRTQTPGMKFCPKKQVTSKFRGYFVTEQNVSQTKQNWLLWTQQTNPLRKWSQQKQHHVK